MSGILQRKLCLLRGNTVFLGMFNLGFPELLALGGLALLVIGPKQLPEVAKVVARTINELKRATKDITGTIAQVKTDAKSQMDDYIDNISEEVGDVEEDYHKINNEEFNEEDLYEGDHDQHVDEDGQLSLLSDEDENRS